MKKKTVIIVLCTVLALGIYALFGPSCYMTDKEAIKLARSFCDLNGFDCSKFILVKPSRGEVSKGFDRKLIKFEKTDIGIDCKTENIVFYKQNITHIKKENTVYIPLSMAENIAKEQLEKVNLSDCSYMHLFAVRREERVYRFIFDSVLSENPKYAIDRGSGFFDLDASNGKLLLYNYSGGKWCSPDIKPENLNDILTISESKNIAWEIFKKLANQNSHSTEGMDIEFISLDKSGDDTFLWKITFTETDVKGKVPADLKGLKVWINAYNGQFVREKWFGKWE